MSKNYTINLPDGDDKTIKQEDTLSLKVTRDCSVSYTQNPSGLFVGLPTGQLNATDPPTTYGPFTPTTTGTLTIDAEPDAKATLCTITVSS